MSQLNHQEKERYSRNILVDNIGVQGQEKLKQSKVLIIGAGGLGCPAALYLVAAGVGHIGIADPDRIESSNLQRQTLYDNEDIGSLKADTAVKKLRSQNPFIELVSYPKSVDAQLALKIFPEFDIILDCTDRFPARYLISDGAVITGKPLIYAGVHLYEGQVAVFNYQNGPNYRCLYPVPPDNAESLSCSVNGVLGIVPGILGMYQANEALKIILNTGNVLADGILIINLLTYQQRVLKVRKDSKTFEKIRSSPDNYLQTDFEAFCRTEKNQNEMKTISPESLHKMIEMQEDFQLIDVRELTETPQLEEMKGLNLPMSSFEKSLDKVDPGKQTIVYCRSGARSASAISRLQQVYPDTEFMNLEGGIIKYIDSIPQT